MYIPPVDFIGTLQTLPARRRLSPPVLAIENSYSVLFPYLPNKKAPGVAAKCLFFLVDRW